MRKVNWRNCLVWLAGLMVLMLASGSFAASGRIGGGYTQGGLQAQYFANATLTGTPAFTRREQRLDFEWGTGLPIGGSLTARLRNFPSDEFSVRFTGQLVAAFTETYTFTKVADDGVRVYVKPENTADWTLLIDAWSTVGTRTANMALVAGQRYDVLVEFRELSGAARLRLLWSSPSTPEEVIGPVSEVGFNVSNWSQAFTDIIMGARNSWESNGNGAVGMDAQGWPQNDAAMVFQESLNNGLDVDPLMLGTIRFTFSGKADISLSGNFDSKTLTYSYDAASNLTSGSFKTANNGSNATYFKLSNTDRNGQSPARKNGITSLRMMRPTSPGSADTYLSDVVFNDHFLAAYSKFTALRVSLNNGNVERFWSERTLPSYFNQAVGKATLNPYPPNAGPNNTPAGSDNGPSWEHKVMLANETGADLYINLPLMASGWTSTDTTSYVYKLAQLIRFGSDGVEPYTAPTANPVYPPLNSNLRVYVELSNEVWNFLGFAFRQSFDLSTLAKLDADAALGNPTALADPLARSVDFAALNYDQLSTAKDNNGNYISLDAWRKRKQMLRIVQISEIFRAVWGTTNMHTRIRPVYEWQYDDANNTASVPLKFANDWFNNADGQTHVTTPRQLNYFLWGGGGASYYGAVNGYGITTALGNASFEEPALPAGYNQAPAGSGWTFVGTAGIARDAGSADDIVPPYAGAQMAYIAGTGSLSRQVTIPVAQTSNQYAFVFRALQRGNNTQKLRLFINGVESNWRSFNQFGGYQPIGYNASNPWAAFVVFWTSGTPYYSSKTFIAAPGSSVTLRIEGAGAADQIAFLEDVCLTSVDQIFADGFPGGGEATGQPVGSGYQNGLNVQANWASAYGLQYVTYEGGWSLGGDTGGTPLQNTAKFKSTGTVAVNNESTDMFHRAGGVLNTLGTYSLWPSWAEDLAEEGLLDVGQYPLMASLADRLSQLPAMPSNGVLVPNRLTGANASLRNDASTGGDVSNRGWLSWNALSSATANYTVTVNTTSGATARLSVDGVPVGAAFATGTTVSYAVKLTRGAHGVRLDSMNGSFKLQQITLGISGAPVAPVVNTAIDNNGLLSLQWGAVAGATRYSVYWGVSSGLYPNIEELGTQTQFVLSALAHDQTYYAVVVAHNALGASAPSAEVSHVSLLDSQVGRLAVWDFAGVDGTATVALATAGTSRVTASTLSLGGGLTASTYPTSITYDSFAYVKKDGVSSSSTLALALSSGLFTETTLTPTTGNTMSITAVTYAPYWQNISGLGGVAWRVGNTGVFTIVPTTGTPATFAGSPLVADLSGVTALQSITQPVTLRLLQSDIADYTFAGIGRYAGNDVSITGKVAGLLSVSRTSIDFGAQAPGTHSVAQALMLRNNDSAVIQLNGFAVSGDYTLTSHCGSSLAPGGQCTLDVVFSPTAIGSRAGTVTVSSSAAGGLVLVVLSGEGHYLTQSIGSIAVSPQSLLVGQIATLSAIATSGLAVSFASSTPTICSISGSSITGLSAGICTVTASQSGNGTYAAATSVSQNISVNLNSQTIGSITFNPASLRVGGASTASATASSGLAVSFASSTPTICSISGSAVTGLAAGTCTVTASQSGNGTYAAATPVSQSIAVILNSQTIGPISFNPASLRVGGASTASATASSGLAVSFASITPTICSTSGSTVTGLAAGTCTVTASQSGNGTYAAATPVSQSLIVSLNSQTIGPISFNPASLRVGGTSTASATASSGLAVSFASSTPTNCSISGSTVAGIAVGACTITARQAGNTSYAAAPQVAANITVVEANPARLINLSTRGQVQTGDNIMIGGFVIGGSKSKKVLIRAVGPNLANFGVSGVLANPMIELHRSSDGVIIASNDDWGSAANAAEITATTLAPVDPKEAAILATLEPGAYTAIVTGNAGGAGVGIVEVYELDHPETPLINISTRGQIQNGDNVMIGGFIIQGEAPKTVLIRAMGPTLTNFGVSGTIANPMLELYKSSDGSVVASNDDWGLAANTSAIAFTGLAPPNPLESAVLITLEPGAYTVVVSGNNGGTGVGIVEVFAQ